MLRIRDKLGRTENAVERSGTERRCFVNSRFCAQDAPAGTEPKPSCIFMVIGHATPAVAGRLLHLRHILTDRTSTQ
jgi:hypothetical protein